MIKVGTCGFSFKDWKGTVYPANIKDKDMLSYYNKNLGFDLVEIDVSYYFIPSHDAVNAWVRKTDDDFQFAAKCNREMTLNEKGKVENPLQVDNDDIFKGFINSFYPMIESGKLLTFLVQFGPVFFKNRKNIEYVKKFRQKFGDLPLTVEFRHKSWLKEEQRESTFKLLKNLNLGYAVVDEPKMRNLPPLVPRATTDLAYVRLHGKSKQWFGDGKDKRYDYFYSDEELMEFIPIIKNLERNTALTSVFFNNCHAGAALKNAAKLRQLLGIARKIKLETKAGQMNLPFD